ncbi:sterol desaturase family protein [Rubrivirga sp.]|uniref:sterol desaturase family protein n=1 Tax=Rubrivirga sp. TaxID=1885344 RepID=UPI003C785C7D
MLQFLLLVAAAFTVMEVASYVLHRWLFHGVLWRLHRTHHDPEHGHGDGLEWNDLFSVAFGVLSVGLIWIGREAPLESTAFPLGIGIAVYGALYFVLHDLYAHGRLGRFRTKNSAAQSVKRAHGRHHQSLTKRGQEPYGLFLFPPSMGRRFERKRDRT